MHDRLANAASRSVLDPLIILAAVLGYATTRNTTSAASANAAINSGVDQLAGMAGDE
jgi:hypothetical protein